MNDAWIEQQIEQARSDMADAEARAEAERYAWAEWWAGRRSITHRVECMGGRDVPTELSIQVVIGPADCLNIIFQSDWQPMPTGRLGWLQFILPAYVISDEVRALHDVAQVRVRSKTRPVQP